ncbi:TadE/TadG family type IV pilus assembly protein [Devosia sp. SL43]|uniref:TadE/TadG family type IV pilus assembly protein n=1 Tax=Devosia sp. SL43 TaxID=2806348 RepID=UPI001F28177E|nr:TadE/TadG family type IV pilus assembly protein [Devosia sp. SL43]UJW86950.1 pilus assembly protein [Devosia sp. SL43]
MTGKVHSGRLHRDQSGATAVEFALLIGPFLFLLLGVLEVSIHYFVSTAVDYAVQRTARLVRTGQAQTQDLVVDDLRQAMCDDILNLFDCESNSYITIEELDSLNASTYVLPVNSSGTFIADQTIEMGLGGSYVIVRGFFQFSPLLDVFGALKPRLNNGNHLVVASVLFRNEPF